MDEARLAGITVWAWDPDKPEDILRMINLGVSAVESNRPDILNKVLREMESIPIG